MRGFLIYLGNNRKIFINLLKNDFKSRYSGAYLGAVWGIVQPVVTVLIYWFVFQVGLRSGDRPDGTPYIVWMLAGIIPWFFFSDALGAVTNTFLEYSYMVKKINFRISLLPFVKIGSSMVLHAIFLIFVTIILNFAGFYAGWSYLEIFYYMAGGFYCVLGIGLITATLTVYMRDVSQLVSIVIQIGFWAIPIVWGPEVLSGRFIYLFKLNPVYYIVEGYRKALISHEWFWSEPVYMLYFWIVTTMVFGVGIFIFRRLKPYFADEL